MAKVINFTYKDVDYTLEYTRKTLEKMEADGIVLAQLDKKPVTILPKLFQYAFFAVKLQTLPTLQLQIKIIRFLYFLNCNRKLF